MAIERIELEPGEEIAIVGKRLGLEVLTRDVIVVKSRERVVPDPDPAPDPEPQPEGLLWEDNFVSFPIGWQYSGENGFYFEKGNASSKSEPTGPEGQKHSMRMKLGDCVKPAGCFPPDTRQSVSIDLGDLPAGDYAFECWQVAHDTGEFALYVVNPHNFAYIAEGKWDKTFGKQWSKLTRGFAHVGGEISVVVEYRSPADEDARSGVKLTGMRLWMEP